MTREMVGTGSLAWLRPRSFWDGHRVRPRGVLHIGAHAGEELPDYEVVGFRPIYLVEPDPPAALWNACAAATTHIVVTQEIVADVTPGETVLWRPAGNTMQSGIGTSGVSRNAVPLSYVQDICPDANVLVVDTSGNESDVLRSGRLEAFDMVIVENDTEGRHASPRSDVLIVMGYAGFRSVERWSHGGHSYGDEVFIRA